MSAETSGGLGRGVRTGLWLLALAVCELVFFGVAGYAAYYWKLPTLAIVALVVLGLAMLAVVVAVFRGARRKLGAGAAIAGITLIVIVASVFLSFVLPVPAMGRVRQIADAAGFSVMVPRDLSIEPKSADGYQPSSDLSPDGVVSLHYAHFDLLERRSAFEASASELKNYANLPQPGPEVKVSIKIDTEEDTSVLGRPALLLSWHEVMEQKSGGTGTILVFQPADVIVTMSSDTTGGNGLSAEEMVRIAETFEPLR